MTSRISERIRARQIEHLYQHLPSSLFAATFITLCLLYFLRDFPDQQALLTWAGLMIVILIFRTGTIIFFTKHPPENQQEWIRAEYRFLAGIIFSGIAWGLLGAWIYPLTRDMDTHQLILIILVGLAGGGSISYSFRRLPVTMLILLDLLPLLYGLYQSSGSQNLAIGLAVLVYIVFLLRSSFTFQHNHEQLLILKEASLQREEKLRCSQRAAEEASRAKTNFLANMSHEIRTPMNVIIGMSRLIKETGLDAKQKKYFSRIESSATILMGQLNGILDFSKIEAGQLILEKQPFLMETLLNGIYSTMIGLAREKGLSLLIYKDQRVPEAFIGDSIRLSQILINLIGNAIKFTDQGEISVHVSLDRNASTKEKKVLYFVVKDTGIGIPADKLRHLFGSFQQADNSISRRYGGTGLGLAISRQLVQLMGGEISLTSTEGMGSTFSFTIALPPCAKETVRQVYQLDPANCGKITGLTVLLVEDNEANRELGTIILESSGQKVQVAENGLQALELLCELHFDVILMDVQMPEMDGVTATRIIRAVEENRQVKTRLSTQLLTQLKNRLDGGHVPIIALTAQAMDSDRRRCLEAGMDEYLTKPFEPEQVVVVLQKFGGREATMDSPPDSNEPVFTTVDDSGVEEDLGRRVRTHLSKTYKLQPEQVDQLLVTSARSLSEHLDKALAAFEAEDGELLREAAHGLKGNLLNLGLQEHAQTAAMIEQRAGAGETRACRRPLISLQTALADLLG